MVAGFVHRVAQLTAVEVPTRVHARMRRSTIAIVARRSIIQHGVARLRAAVSVREVEAVHVVMVAVAQPVRAVALEEGSKTEDF